MSIGQQKATLNVFVSVANHALTLAVTHKKDAMAQGISEEAAEAMSVTLHSALIATVLNELSYETARTESGDG